MVYTLCVYKNTPEEQSLFVNLDQKMNPAQGEVIHLVPRKDFKSQLTMTMANLYVGVLIFGDIINWSDLDEIRDIFDYLYHMRNPEPRNRSYYIMVVTDKLVFGRGKSVESICLLQDILQWGVDAVFTLPQVTPEEIIKKLKPMLREVAKNRFW